MSRVVLVPFELVHRPGLLKMLKRQLKRRLGLAADLGAADFDLEACFSASRRQYDAMALLDALAAQAFPHRIVGITDSDLFLSVFTHVLGAAQLDGVAAVVSTHRLQPETLGLPPDPALLEERLWKEAVHELGHTFGLRHCQDPVCAMFSANNPDEVDSKGSEYRGNCMEIFRDNRGSL
jgi:archaemetzincin